MNPYADIILDSNKDFISTKDLSQVEIITSTNGFNVKTFSLDLYFRQKTDIEERSKETDSSPWYSSSTVSPEKPVILDINRGDYFTYGKLIDSSGNERFYSFSSIQVENRNDFEIRDYYIGIPLDSRVCEHGLELNTRYDKYLVVYLQPHENRQFITFNEVEKRSVIDSRLINISSLCSDDLSKYIII